MKQVNYEIRKMLTESMAFGVVERIKRMAQSVSRIEHYTDDHDTKNELAIMASDILGLLGIMINATNDRDYVDMWNRMEEIEEYLLNQDLGNNGDEHLEFPI